MPKGDSSKKQVEDRVNYLARIVGETLAFQKAGYTNKRILWKVLKNHLPTNDLPAVADMIEKHSRNTEVVCDVSPLPLPLLY